MKRWMNVSIVIMTTIPLLASCLGGADGEGSKPSVKQLVKPLEADEKASLKMYGWADERNFIYNYGSSYLVEYPNIELSFTIKPNGQVEPGTDPYERQFKDIEEQKPDIFVLAQSELPRYAEKGLLYDLDPLIKQDKFDIENIHAGAVEAIREKSGGKLYGLSPTFYSSALFYNKELFDKFKVPYPKDQMTWDELFQLAKKFPTTGGKDERVYGFSAGNTFSFVQQLANIHGVSMIDPDGKKLTANSDAYKRLWNMTIDASKAGYVFTSTTQERMVELSTPTYRSYVGPFASGQAAMSIEGNATIRTMDMLKGSNLKPFEWGMTTVPVDPQTPNESPYYGVGSIFAINAKSPNARAAWQLLKYWNSEQYAAYYQKTKSQSLGSSMLLSRISYNKAPAGKSLEPFYTLKPSKRDYYSGLLKAPVSFANAFSPIQTEETKAITEGSKTVEEALRSLQERGQKELDRAWAEEEAKKTQAK
ncbi:ABC transporter substrate-binding protein [Paenibacillus sp. MBLB4367]|uniref:ABC transporter substrate-binding protein n=1 Tax=Paenibacillus sp. MBLB4367 TaxID=3384767 RepID=UPI003907F00F